MPLVIGILAGEATQPCVAQDQGTKLAPERQVPLMINIGQPRPDVLPGQITQDYEFGYDGKPLCLAAGFFVAPNADDQHGWKSPATRYACLSDPKAEHVNVPVYTGMPEVVVMKFAGTTGSARPTLLDHVRRGVVVERVIQTGKSETLPGPGGGWINILDVAQPFAELIPNKPAKIAVSVGISQLKLRLNKRITRDASWVALASLNAKGQLVVQLPNGVTLDKAILVFVASAKRGAVAQAGPVQAGD